mmetsp:Transcript_37439/g.98188  ORF Transcript_37439/g.98188 Transcript_37439/m.98188 type:complete len:200 (+) Transcript_37439:41-640(+)
MHALRRLSTQVARSATSRVVAPRAAVGGVLKRNRCAAAEAAEDAVPPPQAAAAVSPKVRALADSIAQLNLLEVSELCTVLKDELNIPDAAPMGFAAPMPAMGAAPAAGDGGEADAADEAADAGPSLVSLTLKSFKDDSKIKVIKEVKRIMSEADPKFNLASAKKLVEGLPAKLKEEISKEEADKLVEALEAAGGELEVK